MILFFSQKITANILRKHVEQAEIIFLLTAGRDLRNSGAETRLCFCGSSDAWMDGQSLIKMIKESDSTANIIVVTADVQNHVREEIEIFHIMSFINKPFTDEKAQIICNIMKEKDNGKQWYDTGYTKGAVLTSVSVVQLVFYRLVGQKIHLNVPNVKFWKLLPNPMRLTNTFHEEKR